MSIHVHAIGCLGVPSSAYAPILKRLQKLGVDSVGFTNVHSIPHKDNWKLCMSKVLSDAEEVKAKLGNDSKFIGFGHSLGGALLYGAAVLGGRKQKLLLTDNCEMTSQSQNYHPFDQLVIYEPPLMAPYKRIGMAVMGLTGTFKKFPAVQACFRRPEKFSSRQDAIKFIEKKKFYRKFHPEMLESFKEHALIDMPDGSVEFNFTPQEEADFIMSSPIDMVPDIDWLGHEQYQYAPKAMCDGVVYYSLHYDFASPSDISYQSSTLTGPSGLRYKYHGIDGTHFYPLHNPDHMADLIFQQILNMQK